MKIDKPAYFYCQLIVTRPFNSSTFKTVPGTNDHLPPPTHKYIKDLKISMIWTFNKRMWGKLGMKIYKHKLCHSTILQPETNQFVFLLVKYYNIICLGKVLIKCCQLAKTQATLSFTHLYFWGIKGKVTLLKASTCLPHLQAALDYGPSCLLLHHSCLL